MTDAERWQQAKALFHDALDRPPAERAGYLRRATDDDALRADVEALLVAHDEAEAEDALAEPLLADLSRPPEDDRPDPLLGARLGAWELDERIGEGGMGAVYRAHRADGHFEQEAAVKVLHPGPHARRLADRLAQERALLARLDHPGIARLLDGGLGDAGPQSGLPWLALAFVRGRPLTEYADDHRLTVADRLRLFLQVCDAVAYAHTRLVVHRDLKPSNVLVGSDDAGRPRATVLDFGIAKILGDDDALLTRTGEGALTPAYAAPEQVRGEPVTTATDVYALGVLLYEVLAGRRPYELSGQTAAEAERIVTAFDPPPMSRANDVPSARAARLRGDLDHVAQRALAKEPERRYPTADALAADLRRHLDGLPVEARAPTLAYRFGVFTRRHRAAVAAAGVALLALLVGLGVALWQAGEARAAAATAERAAARAEASQTFLLNMLAAADPDEEGRDVRVASLLDRAAATVGATFADQPTLRADAHDRLGQTYQALGLFPEAQDQLERALASTGEVHGPRDPATAFAQLRLGTVLTDLADYEAADSLFSLALGTLQADFGPRALETAQVLAEIGRLRYVRGDAAGSAEAHRTVLSIERALLPPGDEELIATIGNLAVALSETDSLDAAIVLYEWQIGLLREAARSDPGSLANALANLGSVYAAQDRYDAAAAVQAEAVPLFRQTLGDDHPDLAFGLNNLGATLVKAGRPEEAELLLRESDAIVRSAMGETHPVRGFPLNGLAQALRDLDRPDEARATARLALQLFTDGFGPDHPALERVEATLATLDE